MKILLMIGIIVFLLLLFILPIMLLWNWLMPTIFGLTKITFWQALGLLLLVDLFKGFNYKKFGSNQNRR